MTERITPEMLGQALELILKSQKLPGIKFTVPQAWIDELKRQGFETDDLIPLEKTRLPVTQSITGDNQ